MSTVVNPSSVALSTAELRKRAHVHSAIDIRASCTSAFVTYICANS